MALTAAERSKRYREKIKQDAEKHEQYKKKEQKRLQKHNKKIKDLTEKEKEEVRKKWREQKKIQKLKKKLKNRQPKEKMDENTSSPAVCQQTASGSLIKKYKHLLKVYKQTLKQVENFKTRNRTLRKRLHRTQTKLVEEIKSLREVRTEADKLKARQEVMEASLREAYGDCKKKEHKLVLKRVVKNMGRHSNQKPDHRILGLSSQMIIIRKKKPYNKKIRAELEGFYHRDDISRSTAGKRETRTMKKKKIQIRYLVDTLQNLYQIYKDEGGKCGFTTFFRYKPFYVLSPTVNTRETCMCIRHCNIDLMFNALKLKGVISYKDTTELLHYLSCNTQSYDCMYGKCLQCKSRSIQHKDNSLEQGIQWHKWGRVDHMYEKSGQEITTKKTTKQLMKSTVGELLAVFAREMAEFKKHYFNWKEQQRQYRACITKMKDEEIVILCDFSENYSCKYGQEIQSAHFGASKSSVTLHSGVIFAKNCSQSFVTVSDNNCHEPHGIWAHLIPVIKHAREINPNLKVIHFFSDGPSSQYRQKKNFFLLNLFTQKLNLTYATWSFSEAGHGKSLADGIGGSVKRQLDKRVSFGEDITNGTDVFRVLQARMRSVKSFYVTDQDFNNMLKLIPDQLKPVPQTMQLHQVISEPKSQQIQYRQLSCFCNEMRGLCKCHLPKTHIFGAVSATRKRKADSRIPGPSDINTFIPASSQSQKRATNLESPQTESESLVTSALHTANNSRQSLQPILLNCDDNPICDDSFSDTLHVPVETLTNNVPGLFDDQNLSDIILLDMEGAESILEKISPQLFRELSSPIKQINEFNHAVHVDDNRGQHSPSTEKVNTNTLKSHLVPSVNKKAQSPVVSKKNTPLIQSYPATNNNNENELQAPSKKQVKNDRASLNNNPFQAIKTEKGVRIHKPCQTTFTSTRLSSISRTFPCYVCKTRQQFNLQVMAKCMVCKNWVCFTCSGTTEFDYVCPVCLEVGVE